MNSIFTACLSYNNIKRKESMINRFNSLGMEMKFFDGVSHNDDRLINLTDKQTSSILFGHLDILRDFFFNSDKKYAFIFEDDTIIHKDFVSKIKNILVDFEQMNLDILLLGYLINFVPTEHKITGDLNYSYYCYGDDLWGTQAMLVSRKHARDVISNYKNFPYDGSLGIDSILTKQGSRAMIYPPLACEDGLTKYLDQGQQSYHDSCYKFCVNKSLV